MALRSLLRRVAHPVLVSPSAPRMLPVSPAALARFVTASQPQGPVHASHLPKKSTRVSSQHFIDEQIKSDKEFAQLKEVAGQSLAEFLRAVDELKTVGNASTFVIAALPWVMIIGSNYLG